MTGRILSHAFYEKPTLEVAEALLGCILVRERSGKKICARIIETEAYIGEDDLACHASKGRTKRTEIMYGEAGYAYIYLVYGIHELLNTVTEKRNFPAAVLIRTVEIDGVPIQKTNGPGKLTKFLGIDRSLLGIDLTVGKTLWIEKGTLGPNEEIHATPRIGINYAKHCVLYPWRFIIQAKPEV